jgi:hypothetical protein
MLFDSYLTTIVTVVILVGVNMLAEVFAATIIAFMVKVSVFANAILFTATIVAEVILIEVTFYADDLGANIALMIQLGIDMIGETIYTAVIALVIIVALRVNMLTDCYCATVVAGVILISICMHTEEGSKDTTLIVANMILISIYMLSNIDTANIALVILTGRTALGASLVSANITRNGVGLVYAIVPNLAATIITNVILVGSGISAYAKRYCTTVVALMILVVVLVNAKLLVATVVACMVKVSILALTELILTANVAGMIKVGICAVVKNLAAVIARVILIRGRILANAEVYIATVIAEVILIII